MAVTQATLPLLHEAPADRIVNLGDSSGSPTFRSNLKCEHRHLWQELAGATYPWIRFFAARLGRGKKKLNQQNLAAIAADDNCCLSV